MALIPSTMLELGSAMPSFELLDTVSGEQVSSAQLSKQPVLIAIICNHCPYVKHIKRGIAELGRYCQQVGVRMVAVSPNDPDRQPADSPNAMAEEATRFGYVFPYLFDEQQNLARELRAVCTPEFYLFDDEHRLVYRGQMDDARPNNDRPVTGADVRAAIDAVRAGAAPSPKQKPSIGCSIKWKPGNEPDYAA